MPANTAHAAVLASDQDAQSGRWSALGLRGEERGGWGPNACDGSANGLGPDGPGALPCLNSNLASEGLSADTAKAKLNQLSTSPRKTVLLLARTSSGSAQVRDQSDRFSNPNTPGSRDLCEGRGASLQLASNRGFSRSRRRVEMRHRAKEERAASFLSARCSAIRDPHGIRFRRGGASSGNYGSANNGLRSEWARWCSITDCDGRHPQHAYAVAGRAELMPSKTNSEGISKYVGKYIAKPMGATEQRDKGVCRVRYSNGGDFFGPEFMGVSVRSRLWRWQAGEFAQRNGIAVDDFDGRAAMCGKRWAIHQGGPIMDIEPPPIVGANSKRTEEAEGEWTALRNVWEADRYPKLVAVAAAAGCSQWDASAPLFMPGLTVELASE